YCEERKRRGNPEPCCVARWIASLSLSSGAHSRDPLDRNDGVLDESGQMTNRSANVSGEDSLIARYFKPIATDPGAFGLDDDAAVLKARGEDIVVTTDAIVEGVHFLPDDPPDTVARKALRVNLSDIAAKGATPAGFVLTLALRGVDETWLAAFARGLGEDASSFSCPPLGGDTVSTPG